jgi:hypothetical protein
MCGCHYQLRRVGCYELINHMSDDAGATEAATGTEEEEDARYN